LIDRGEVQRTCPAIVLVAEVTFQDLRQPCLPSKSALHLTRISYDIGGIGQSVVR
jgi:hypothetical protein